MNFDRKINYLTYYYNIYVYKITRKSTKSGPMLDTTGLQTKDISSLSRSKGLPSRVQFWTWSKGQIDILWSIDCLLA